MSGTIGMVGNKDGDGVTYRFWAEGGGEPETIGAEDVIGFHLGTIAHHLEAIAALAKQLEPVVASFASFVGTVAAAPTPQPAPAGPSDGEGGGTFTAEEIAELFQRAREEAAAAAGRHGSAPQRATAEAALSSFLSLLPAAEVDALQGEVARALVRDEASAAARSRREASEYRRFRPRDDEEGNRG